MIQLKSQLRKRDWREKGTSVAVFRNRGVIPAEAGIQANSWIPDQVGDDSFINSLPFKLTKAQERCLSEIVTDLGKETPMNRLLEGDVGSGKTVVASAAIFECQQAGLQSIIMAPTEVLAEQHYQTLKKQ